MPCLRSARAHRSCKACSANEFLFLPATGFVVAVGHAVSSVGVAANRKAAERAIPDGAATDCPPPDGESCERDEAEREPAEGETTRGQSTHRDDTNSDATDSDHAAWTAADSDNRSEEHTSELQS